jgi:hypothetical protein
MEPVLSNLHQTGTIDNASTGPQPRQFKELLHYFQPFILGAGSSLGMF